MSIYRAQVVLPFFTNLPEDVITNTFHFEATTGATPEQVSTDVTPHISAFYRDGYGGAGIAFYINKANAHINWYNLSNPEPRVPFTAPLDLAALSFGNSNVPTEVALCLSFQGVPLSGVPQSRRRGRVFIGGIPQNTIDPSIGNNFPRWITSYAVGWGQSAEENLRVLSVPTEANWVVWSPTTQEAVEVNNGWVDNSPDTQRRRSVGATQRNIWGDI